MATTDQQSNAKQSPAQDPTQVEKKSTAQKDYEEYEKLRKEDPAKLATKDDEPVHFDCTIAKLVKYTDSDGNETWEEVMSDTLYPGEKLKRVEDDNAALDKDEKSRREAARDQRGVTGDSKK